MNIPSWSFRNVGQSMIQIKPKNIKKKEKEKDNDNDNPPEITHSDKTEEFPPKTPIVLIKESANPPEITHSDKTEEFPPKTPIILIKESANPPETTTNYDKIEEFLLSYINLGFEINLELIIELYI
jgi:hypothetical protein